jgi:WD40 repeat protein
MQFNLSSAICSVPGAGTGPGLVRAYPCAALDISTNYCFAGTGVGEMVVYNIPNHLYRVAVPVCSNGVTAIAVSPVPRPNNVTVLYVSGGDGSLRKLRGYDQSWEVLREARIGSKISSLSLVPATSSSGDDSELIAATADGRIFRVLCGDLLFTEVLQSHTAAVGNVSFEKSRSDMLVSASLDGSIRTWDLNTYLAVTEIRVQDKQMQGTSAPLCTFPIGDCVLSGWSDGYVRCHDSRTGRLMWQIVNAHRGKVQAICVTDVAIVTAGEDRHVRVWSLRSHELVVQFSDHQRPITAVAADVRADKPHLLYSVGLDRCMTTYDLRKQRREKSHSAGESGFNCLAQRKCADFEFLCGAGEGRIVMLDEDIPQPTKIFATGVGQVRAVAVSPSGKWLATGCDDGVLRVWDALKLECICEGVCHSEPLLTLTWTPDEKQIVSGGADCSICVWNVYEN